MTLGVQAPIQLLGIDHVALHVGDLETSAKWYRDRFGFTILHKWTTTWMIGGGNMKTGLFLRLGVMPLEDPDKLKIIQHFALAVDGDKFQAAIDSFKAGGAEVGPIDDTGIAYSAFLKDPDGNEVEVTSYCGTAAPLG